MSIKRFNESFANRPMQATQELCQHWHEIRFTSPQMRKFRIEEILDNALPSRVSLVAVDLMADIIDSSMVKLHLLESPQRTEMIEDIIRTVVRFECVRIPLPADLGQNN
jgi:hypothetical protein